MYTKFQTPTTPSLKFNFGLDYGKTDRQKHRGSYRGGAHLKILNMEGSKQSSFSKITKFPKYWRGGGLSELGNISPKFYPSDYLWWLIFSNQVCMIHYWAKMYLKTYFQIVLTYSLLATVLYRCVRVKLSRACAWKLHTHKNELVWFMLTISCAWELHAHVRVSKCKRTYTLYKYA